MTNYLLKISRSLFKLVTGFDDLLRFESLMLEELRAIRELLADKRENLRDQQFLTVEDLALRLQVTKRTVYKWQEDGKLDSVRIGTKRYFKPIDL